MAYFDADMDAEQTPVVDRTDTEYTIYVNNLPSELNEDAIRQIFGGYGEITGMFYTRNATWTYITYATYREAEYAIRNLNNKKPLCLKVALAKERSSMREELQSLPVPETYREGPEVARPSISTGLFAHNDTKSYSQQSMGRGRPLHVLRKHIAIPRVVESGPLSSSIFSQASNTHAIEEPFVHTNRLWTRGMITVTPDGKRHVSLGRGYTLYEFPEENPKIEEYVTKVYERRQNGLYEYSEDKLKNEVQRCLICSTITVKHCEKCYTYYCSKVCQVNDWPRHQAQCQRIPALVEETVNDISSLQISKNEKQTKVALTPSAINKTIASDDVKLRRPNAIQTENKIQQNATENSNNTNANNIHKNNADFTYQCSTNNTSTNNQDRHSSTECDNDVNVSQTKRADQFGINVTNTKDSSQQNRSRKYNYTNEDTDQLKRNDGYSSSNSINQSNYNRNHPSGAISKTSPREYQCNRFDNSNVRGRSYNNDRNQPYQRNGFQNDRKFISNNKENVNRQENNASSNIAINDNLAFYKDTYLSKTEFTQVEIIASLRNGEYWIYKPEDTNARLDLMTKLQDIAERSRNVQPIIGNIYGVHHETLWTRAMILSLNPIKINFIDFGNNEILNNGADIKDIQGMTKVPRFARKIRLTQITNEEYKNLECGKKIFVRMLSMDAEKTIEVEVQEQSRNSLPCTTSSASSMNNAVEKFVPKVNSNILSDKNTKSSAIQTPSILDAFADLLAEKAITELEIVGLIQIHESTQKNIYSATMCPQIYSTEIEMVFNNLQDECEKIQESTNVNYKPEDLICGKWEDGWYRGYVFICPTTSSGLRIFTIDEARILSVEQIVPCPIIFLNICAFGVMCEVTHPTIELQVGEVYNFKAFMNEHSHKQQSLKIEITKDSKVITAVVKPWKYIKSLIRTLSELKSGSKICLTSYQNQCDMFARSLDEAEVEYYNNIMQRIALCARTAPRLSNPPNIGQIVIAPFYDGNSYRALVIETQNDKAKIVYIDFGNVEEGDIKEFQVLPDGLALQRSCSAKISLKDVSRDIPLNKEVDLYLRNLVGKEISLICVYEGASFKDGIHLTMLTGESINDNINQLLIPDWKKENRDDKMCYMLNDIGIANLGHVGDIVKAIVLTIKEDGMRYMMSPFDIDLITHITETMPPLFKEYSENTEYYIPRADELCLALYDEAWYRAVCLKPRESNTTCQIFFIDYGNTESIEHKNIRLMPKDFIVPEAMANICTVVNLAPVDETGNYSCAVQQKLKELIPQDSIVKIKIIDCFGSGDYKIELPDIRAALIREGLVRSSGKF